MSTDTLDKVDDKVDESVLELLDFSPRCEVCHNTVWFGRWKQEKPQCKRSATHSARWPCCGGVILACKRCTGNRGDWYCYSCDKTFRMLLWRPLK